MALIKTTHYWKEAVEEAEETVPVEDESYEIVAPWLWNLLCYQW